MNYVTFNKEPSEEAKSLAAHELLQSEKRIALRKAQLRQALQLRGLGWQELWDARVGVVHFAMCIHVSRCNTVWYLFLCVSYCVKMQHCEKYEKYVGSKNWVHNKNMSPWQKWVHERRDVPPALCQTYMPQRGNENSYISRIHYCLLHCKKNIL